jgi:hypothetical protein
MVLVQSASLGQVLYRIINGGINGEINIATDIGLTYVISIATTFLLGIAAIIIASIILYRYKKLKPVRNLFLVLTVLAFFTTSFIGFIVCIYGLQSIRDNHVTFVKNVDHGRIVNERDLLKQEVETLKSDLENGYISKEEYKAKLQEIVERMAKKMK